MAEANKTDGNELGKGVSPDLRAWTNRPAALDYIKYRVADPVATALHLERLGFNVEPSLGNDEESVVSLATTDIVFCAGDDRSSQRGTDPVHPPEVGLRRATIGNLRSNIWSADLATLPCSAPAYQDDCCQRRSSDGIRIVPEGVAIETPRLFPCIDSAIPDATRATRHANGVLGVTGLTYVAHRPIALVPFFKAAFGSSDISYSREGVVITVDEFLTVEILTRSAALAQFGSLYGIFPAGHPGLLMSLRLETAMLSLLCERLDCMRLRYTRRGRSIFMPATDHFGPLEFHETTYFQPD